MRNSYLWFSALTLATLASIPLRPASAAWEPSMPKDANVIVEVSNQGSPLSFPRGEIREDAGGILGAFKAKSVTRHGVLLVSYPLEIRVSRNSRLEVRNLKTGQVVTHPTVLKADVTHRYKVSCDASGWTVIVDGQSLLSGRLGDSTCIAGTWGRPVVAASDKSGLNALAGSLDLTWYAGARDTAQDDGTDPAQDDGTGEANDESTEPGDPGNGKLAFVGDFETGDLSQWVAVGASKKLPYAAAAERGEARGGRYAGRMEVRFMDRGVDADGEPRKVRAEVFESPVPLDTEWFYGWSSMIDPAWNDQNQTWFIIQQFHQNTRRASGSPPLFQRYAGGQWSIRCLKELCGGKGILWKENVPKGRWQDFVYQIKWSPNKDGRVRVWLNGRQIVDYRGPNMRDASKGPYFKFGIYRGGSDQETQTIWHDEYRRGTSKEAVDPRNYR